MSTPRTVSAREVTGSLEKLSSVLKMMTRTITLSLLLLSVSCSAPTPPPESVLDKATFDLNCPKEQLSKQMLDSDTVGVRGCDRQAKYVKVCHATMTFPGKECKWLRN
jgi:hypothetical protein